MKLPYVFVTLTVVLSLGLGCAKKGPKPVDGVVPVQGVATLDGKPLAGVVVMFCPEVEGSPSAAGTTDQNGRFRLTSFPSGDGARPGKYKVMVTPPPIAGPPRQPSGSGSVSNVTLPTTYGLPTTTPLGATVPTEGDVVLELKSKP